MATTMTEPLTDYLSDGYSDGYYRIATKTVRVLSVDAICHYNHGPCVAWEHNVLAGKSLVAVTYLFISYSN